MSRLHTSLRTRGGQGGILCHGNRCILALAGALAGALAAPCVPCASAQARRPVEAPRHGVEVFANLLHEQGLKPLTGTDELAEADPEKTVIVLFGRLEGLGNVEKAIEEGRFGAKWFMGRRPPRGLSHFLNSGGAVLIASDYADGGRLASLRVGISGLPVFQQRRFSFLGQYPSCPVMWIGQGFAPHPVFRDLKKPLATMRPSTFSFVADYWRSVAWYPDETYLGMRGGLGMGPRDSPGQAWMLAAPAEVPGRGLVLAGHGVFMNSFLVRQDHDNFRFARNVVRYLAEGPKGPRTHVLFVEQGETAAKLDLSLESPPLPVGFLLNTLLDQAQRQGQPEDLLRKNVQPTTIWRWLLIVLTGLMVLLACRRVLLARFRRDTSAALVVGLHEKPPPPLPLNRQRQDEILSGRDFAAPARVLARQWLLERGVLERSSLPTHEIQASWWRRRRLEKSLRWLAQLAGLERLGTVSARQLRRLRGALVELNEAFRSGEIRFVSPAAAPKKD